MIKISLVISSILSVISLLGCQESRIGNPQIFLHTQLPQSLERGTLRNRHLLERALFMTVELKSGNGTKSTANFSPKAWDNITLGDVALPKDNDNLTITATIWDRTSDGRIREFPVLAGSVVLKADSYEPDGVTKVALKLGLKVSIREFD